MTDLTAFLAEVTLCLERPDEVTDHPVAEAVNIDLQLLVDLGAPGWKRVTQRLEAIYAPEAEITNVVDGLLKLEALLVLDHNDHVVRVACSTKVSQPGFRDAKETGT